MWVGQATRPTQRLLELSAAVGSLSECGCSFLLKIEANMNDSTDKKKADAELEREIRKGAADAVKHYVEANGGRFPSEVSHAVAEVARRGSTPLVVAERIMDKGEQGARVLGVIELKDVVKGGIKERFAELRKMGIKTVMVTGDNRLTAAAIAAEAGVDDFLAEATPEAKLATIRAHQAEGRLVAMPGIGTVCIGRGAVNQKGPQNSFLSALHAFEAADFDENPPERTR